MNDRQLRYACAVWREHSFSQAAKKLSVSQPTVSDQIRLLEEEIGFLLFHRGLRGVDASTVGEAFLEKAEQVLAGIANLELLGRQLRGDGKVKLRIGINSGVHRTLLSRAVELIRALEPNIHLEIVTATSRRILRLIDQDRIDLGFLLGANLDSASQKVVTETMADSALVITVAEDHPLTSEGGSVRLEQLAAHPLVLTDAHAGLGHLVLGAFTARGLMPQVAADCDNIDAVIALVAGGVGIALLPGDAVRDNPSVTALALADAVSAPISIARNANANSIVARCIAGLGGMMEA